MVAGTFHASAQMPEIYPQGISVAVSLAYVEPAGIAISETGRMFLAFPRGGMNHSYPSVVEVVDGNPRAFPDEKVNENVNIDLPEHLVSVLGITLYKNTLWILDQGKRAGINGIPDGSVKIVAVDINTKEIIKNIPFPKPFFRETIQLNDLRFDPTHGKEGTVYISNNGFAKPDQSIIVADVATGKLRELFRNAPEVSPQKGFMSFVEGKPHLLNYEKPTMPQGGVNGIELSPDFKTLYWTTPTIPIITVFRLLWPATLQYRKKKLKRLSIGKDKPFLTEVLQWMRTVPYISAMPPGIASSKKIKVEM
ncbi:L-dopachrome tautomerase-related protein [Chryseobacterium sp. FH2]|uniref:L-dopachrome tautomerase-related protein n=1 Tax=Chryseobacterium sp. FH2 TaxID=1674291 RepID=UPI000A9D7C88|nr:L-dopachrome tautomerase-related protein [Chryseobacterium sp. FH2]